MEDNDHRVIGPRLKLFHQQEDAPGTVFWHPNGLILWRVIEDYIRKLLNNRGYVEVKSPQLVGKGLWEKSGHWEKFKDAMFVVESEQRVFSMKPMNCPCHIEIFKQGMKSYRDLPYRMAEFGACHRNEPSGSLHGIMRVRAFTQDDAHIFCTDEQVFEEVHDFIGLALEVYTKFGFGKPQVTFSTRPKNSLGTDEQWKTAEESLTRLMQFLPDHKIDAGGGAFYGPKIEFSINDSMGRSWQLGTIQLDFNLPGRLGATYVGSDDKDHTPLILHRAILGSMERFIGILLEHYNGALPFWLSPVQIEVLPIADRFSEYSDTIVATLKEKGYRARSIKSSDPLGAKIKDAQERKTPYMLVVGEKEVLEESVSVRHREKGNVGKIHLNEFITTIEGESAFMERIICPGCQRELTKPHKMCPAWGTPFYMSGKLFTEEGQLPPPKGWRNDEK